MTGGGSGEPRAGRLRGWRAAVACALVAGLGGPAEGGAGAAEGADHRDGAVLDRYAFSHAAMGTKFRIVLYAEAGAGAEAAAREAFGRVDRLDRLLSDYRPDSEVSALAEAAGSGVALSVDPDTWKVLLASRAVAEATRGAFDPTVGSLTRVWRRAARRGLEPEAARWREARAAVGWADLALGRGERTVELRRPGARLDLGGIAKGYAVDAAYELLRERGFTRVLVDGGGDLRLGEPPPGSLGWRVAVPARGPGGTLDWRTRELARTAVATSGPSARSPVLEGARRSHILDPRTGRPVPADRRVTVIAPTATRADALASALAVLGEGGAETVRSLGALEARVLDLPGTPAGSRGAVESR